MKAFVSISMIQKDQGRPLKSGRAVLKSTVIILNLETATGLLLLMIIIIFIGV
jgi:hypothetical protein